MPQIIKLSNELINKIAAGEVVERPASVVKELIENSLDAKASQIVIEIKNAGRKLIRVSDNGIGMDQEDLILSLERHATSKIKSENDLFKINTLGFRGEALPSIASVSNIEIVSNNGIASNKIYNRNSKFEVEKCAGPKGTSIEIKNLFYNIPARLKFLKSNITEENQITKIVTKYVLAYPKVSFQLIVDGKTPLKTNGSGEYYEVLNITFGKQNTPYLKEISSEKNNITIYGYVSLPSISRGDRNFQHIFVNGRAVRNFMLTKAAENAYASLIPNGRYPIFTLFINVPADKVDVNVHPAKSEIKFQNIKEVTDLLFASIKNQLTQLLNNNGSEMGNATNSVFGFSEELELKLPQFSSSKLIYGQEDIELEITSVQPLIPLYQLASTYIVATNGESLTLIDQHAAHERIIFDKLSKGDKHIDSQILLSPISIELSRSDFNKANDNIEYLKKIGFEIEEFGGENLLIRAVPQIIANKDIQSVFMEIIFDLSELISSRKIENKKDAINKSIACRAAIKSGQTMNIEEMNQLIKDLYATENPLTCPHGRPTMVELTIQELERRFLR